MAEDWRRSSSSSSSTALVAIFAVVMFALMAMVIAWQLGLLGRGLA